MAVWRLDERTPSVKLRPQRPDTCPTGGPRLAFFTHRRGVRVELRTGAGRPLTRTLPWRVGGEPLLGLARQGRLGAIAVVVEGLVLEERAIRDARRAPAMVHAYEASPPEPSRPARLSEAAGEPDSPPAGADPPGERPAPRARPRSVPARRVERPMSRPALRTASTARRASASGASVAPAPSPAAAPIPSPAIPPRSAAWSPPTGWVPPAPEPAPFPPAATSASPRAPQPLAPAAAPVGASAARAEAPAPASTARSAPFELVAFSSVALRAPSLTAGELGARLGWGGLRAELGWMPTQSWTLGDRPLESTAWFGLFGYAIDLVAPGAWRAELTGGVAGEWLTVERLELPDAQTWNRSATGLEAQLRAGRIMGAGWEAGVALAGRWLVTANDVVIPGGPRAPLNTWRLRLALELSWRSTSQ